MTKTLKVLCWLVAVMIFVSSAAIIPVYSVKAESNGITTAMIQAICDQYGYKDRKTYWVYNEKKDKASHPKLPDDWYVGSTDSSYNTKNQIGSGKTLSYRVGSLYECAGFASFIGWKLTGSKPKTGNINSSSGLGSGWKAYTVMQITNSGGVQPGDIIRTGSHSAVVYSVNSNGSFTVAECWGGTKNTISIGHGFNGKGSSSKLSSISGVKYVLRYGNTVQELPEEPTITGATYPTTLSNGSSFGLRGTITCKYTINEICATVTNRVTKANIFNVSVTPNSTSYSIGSPSSETINSKLAFNSSSCNNSYLNYKLTVRYTRNGSSYSKVVLDQNFTVGTPAGGIPVDYVTVSPASATIDQGSTITLTASVSPSDAGNTSVYWTTSNSNVATVNASGVVTGVGGGTATITVYSADGTKSAACTVTVKAPPTLNSVSFSKTKIKVGENGTITAVTSTNVTKLSMYNGSSLVASWTKGYTDSNAKRTWNVTYTFKSAGVQILTFKGIDANGTMTASKTASITIEEKSSELTPEQTNKVKAFITRCYNIILGRAPDAGGVQTWYNELTSGRKTASEIIDRFVNSPEYLNKNYNYGNSVDILYQAMLGRKADAGGKANWVKKLQSGQTLAHVINGFCFSKEFRDLCDSYGIKAGFVNIPNTDTTAEGKIKAFVQRCYRIILDREADPSGMQTWYQQLASKKKAAAEIIDRFVNSPEFSGKNYSHSDSVEILYKAMLGRGSDASGKANWVNKLDAGQPFAVVINGFCVSKEFRGICDSYGIKPGSVQVQYLSGQAEEEALSMLALNAKAPITRRSETKPNRVEIINPSDTLDMNIGTAVQAVYINEEKAKEFIGRCYRVILGREAGPTELENWIGQMVNGTKTPDQIARGFLFSSEFKGKNTGNEDLVKILYRVYMNRDADPEGLKTWTEKLNGGMALKDLLDTFSKTNEFKKVVSEMGK